MGEHRADHLETERVFAPPEAAELPDLTRAGPVSRVERARQDELDATYLDTPGLVLLHAGVTLRRRTGGADEGWHLKLPTGVPESRRELHEPLGDGPDRPPAALLDLVAGWTRGIEVAPVARIRTQRTTHRLVGPDGRVLAELADDRVTGQPAQLGGEEQRWREWEVELVEGDAGLLDVLEAVLAAHDVHRSAVARKVAVVLGALGPGSAGPVVPPVPGRKDPARLHLHRYLVEQVLALAHQDPAVRRGEAGGVHEVRKACRRLRAALAAYRPLLDREVTDPLREELRWLARTLGPARDREVVVAHLAARLDALGDDRGRALLDRYAAGRAEEDRAEVAEALGSTRYHALRTDLDRLVAEPPWTARAEARDKDVLPARLAREGERVARLREDGAEPHELRKALKRLRYAAEVLEPAWGRPATRVRKAARASTRMLGEAQDSVAARRWLEALAAEAARSGVPAFTLGRLHAQEEQRGRDALRRGGQEGRDLARALSRW